jgi:hypothetical protein
MAMNVHSASDVGRILIGHAALVGFVIVALAWAPHWVSPDTANITGDTGGTSRMID